jgi:hypothetical protein
MEGVGIFNVHFGNFYGHLVCIVYGHLVIFTAIWYICWSFGTFFPVLVCCTKKKYILLVIFAAN